MGSMHGGNVVIAGASETTTIGTRTDVSVLGLHAEAARNAIADAGLDIHQIDGVATAGVNAFEVSDYLGIRPRWIDGTLVGGCSFMLHVRHAAAAVASGAANTILITHGESGRSRIGAAPYTPNPASFTGQFEHVYGSAAPYSAFTVPAMRFLHDRGMTRDHLAHVVVAQRTWAQDNPRAMRRTPTTVEEVLNGPSVAYPFSKDMCCVVTDGGGALIVTSAERAQDMKNAQRLVYLLGSGEAAESPLVSQMDDYSSFGAFKSASTEAFATAGITQSDVDHLMAYDAFAHVPLYMLEDLGFVKFGESGDFVADGNTVKGGPLPMNTNGGGLSYTHSGMYGMFAIQEAVRQLRGEAAAQIPDLHISFVQGVGYFFGAAGSLVLSNQRP
jgi:acetyl-CoA acetyltransferase